MSMNSTSSCISSRTGGGKLSVDFVNKIVNHVYVFRGIILYTKVPGENYTGSVFKNRAKLRQ